MNQGVVELFMNSSGDYKFIHLLYVPTMACNMACKYCYLEENTVDAWGKYDALETLSYAVDKFSKANVIPFNISLHGGEVTTLSHDDFEKVIAFIDSYYRKNKMLIESNDFKVGSPHIKTNLYHLKKHLDTIEKYNVSISGSLDLPLSLHDEYRLTKDGKGTLDTILENVKLLEKLPNKKKVSATIFKEHFDLEQIVKDIKYLHKNTCLDMNDFNFMIGFSYNSNGLLHPLTEDEQVALFHKMHEEFDGTELDAGVHGAWFNEFGPDYCTNCTNCGEKFFLLEKNGDIYSCVRGQKNKDYYYGNIFKDEVSTILENARNKIFLNHNRLPFSEKCGSCKYLYLCKTGCPFVKNTYHQNQSYTCKLQQELYKERQYEEDSCQEETVYDYVKQMHPSLMQTYYPQLRTNEYKSLEELIAEDSKLKYIYDSSCFILNVDGVEYFLESQILRKSHDLVYITPSSSVQLYIKDNLLDEECDYPQNNSLYIMFLSGDLIQYGDEKRIKQAHIATHQVYKGVLEKVESDREGFFQYDMTFLFHAYKDSFAKESPNNLFFTTSALRDYHYLKQKNNAYYHIDAINLPFQNIEFYYIGGDKDVKKES